MNSTTDAGTTRAGRRVSWSAAARRGLPWLAALLLATPLLLALSGLALAWATPAPETWAHLRAHVLPGALANTGALLLAVGIGCAVLGTACAWLNARHDYPGRRLFEWALLLPLALPTYVVAFVAIGLLDYAGPVQSAWRAATGSRAALFSPNGWPWAAALLVLCLYPYVYLTVRSALLRQGEAPAEAARSLGLGRWRTFWRIRLPLLRPALMAGLGLALLETLAEFGAVSLLGVETLTTAVYKTWFGLYSLPAAAQLASLGLLLAAVLLLAEWRARARQRQYDARLRPATRQRLRGPAASIAILAQAMLLLLAFVLPLVQLLAWSLPELSWSATELRALGNTVRLGALAAVLLVGAGLVQALLRRRAASRPALGGVLALSTLGYGVPGTVLAAGLLLGLLSVERGLAAAGADGVLLTGTLGALLLALQARFLRASAEPLAAGLALLRPSLPEAARSLGAGAWRRLLLTLPMLRPSVLAALLLVAIEVMKELPATLMLRPFGWDTLAIRIYALTSEGLWREAARPALGLVLAGLLPIWWLVRLQNGPSVPGRPGATSAD
ncbi:MAG: iron ABC transporter permease [Xanthomonadales bacterium]|nr:iron ABC transporter permease [Xanthomonadales bacterium]